MSDSVRIVIDADEPFFVGHFPGEPLVPGVVILRHVIDQITRRAGGKHWPRRFDGVKFLAPLRPGAELSIELEAIDATTVRFRCRSGATAIATGAVTLCPEQRASAP